MPPPTIAIPPTSITEAVGSTIAVAPLSAPPYLVHCKSHEFWVDHANANNDAAQKAQIVSYLASVCSLLVQAPVADYILPEMLAATNNRIRIIGYAKTNQYEGGKSWSNDLPGWTSPATGTGITFVEYIELRHKMNIRYTLAGNVETTVDASQTELYVYVQPEDWYRTYINRGQACGRRGINILPSTTTQNVSKCAWYNHRKRSAYQAACTGGSTQSCAAEIALCDADRSTMTREYVFWIRVGDELMRVVNMEPAPLSDSAWQSQTAMRTLKDTYHSASPTWDSSYTNGGTGLLTKVYSWNPITYDASTFWSSNTPFLTETLVGCTDGTRGFLSSDDWRHCLGLTVADQASFALEMTGSLVIKDMTKTVQIRTRCQPSSCNVYLGGSNIYGQAITASSGWGTTQVELAAGTHSFRLEYFKRSDDSGAPQLRLELKNVNEPTDDNFMHVEAFGPGTRSFRHRLTVVRGIDGSIAVPHSGDAAVASPIYEGSRASSCGGGGAPESGSNQLTYFAEKNAEAMNYWGVLLAQRMNQSNAQHGEYFDASSLQLPSYNMGDAKGRHSRPWSFATGARMTDAENMEAYKVQYNVMQNVVFHATGVYPVFVANGNGPRYGDPAFDEFLVPGRSVRAGVFAHTERGVMVWNDDWEREMKDVLYSFQENLGMSLQCKVGNPWRPTDAALTYTQAAELVRKFEHCYAGYLMAKSAGKHTAQIELDLTAFAGISTWYSIGIHDTTATFPIALEALPMFTYPLGDPVEEIPHASWPATSYRVAPYTYARRYQNGMVLINPYDPTGISFDDINRRRLQSTAAFDDDIVLSGKMIDAATGEVVDRLTVRGGTARFLLNSPTWTGTVAGADKQHVAYFRAMGLNDDGQEI